MRNLVQDKYDNKTVSVITPVYNAERFIEKTIKSALTQSYKDIEIVLVDDCSKDDSSAIISRFVKHYSNVKYHLQSQNMGAAIARNTALDIAKGRYVAFLDSDDMWLPDKIERQLELMHTKDIAFCFAAIDFIDESDNIVKPRRDVRECIDYNFLLKNTMIATSTVVIDRQKTGHFQMPLRRGGQDYATWLMLLRNGTRAYGINDVLCHYRLSAGSLSSNKWKSIKQVWQIQIQNEKISCFAAAFNVCCFIINALKKYYT